MSYLFYNRKALVDFLNTVLKVYVMKRKVYICMYWHLLVVTQCYKKPSRQTFCFLFVCYCQMRYTDGVLNANEIKNNRTVNNKKTTELSVSGNVMLFMRWSKTLILFTAFVLQK